MWEGGDLFGTGEKIAGFFAGGPTICPWLQVCVCHGKDCPDPGLSWGPQDLQSCALPVKLSGLCGVCLAVTHSHQKMHHTWQTQPRDKQELPTMPEHPPPPPKQAPTTQGSSGTRMARLTKPGSNTHRQKARLGLEPRTCRLQALALAHWATVAQTVESMPHLDKGMGVWSLLDGGILSAWDWGEDCWFLCWRPHTLSLVASGECVRWKGLPRPRIELGTSRSSVLRSPN